MLNDVLGKEYGEKIVQEIGEFIETMKVLGWKEQKPWQEFFQVFKPPGWTFKDIEQRIVTNFLHYRSNYVAIACGVFLLRIIFAPILFLSIIFCGSITTYVAIVHKSPIFIGEYKLNQNTKLLICGVLSFIFLGLFGALEHLLWGVIISSFLCLLHMIFRPRNISSKANRVYEEMKISTSDWFVGKSDHPSPASDDLENAGFANSDDENVHQGITSASMRKRKV